MRLARIEADARGHDRKKSKGKNRNRLAAGMTERTARARTETDLLRA
jgi:hypothetical protein